MIKTNQASYQEIAAEVLLPLFPDFDAADVMHLATVAGYEVRVVKFKPVLEVLRFQIPYIICVGSERGFAQYLLTISKPWVYRRNCLLKDIL